MTRARRLFEALCRRAPHPLPAPAVLLIAAHPDDETIGSGGQLAHWPMAGILHVTDGAPRGGADARAAGFGSVGEYAAARRAELGAALALVGLEAARSWTLGIPDQETICHLVEIVEAVEGCLQSLRPEVVVTHAYEGGHPDHDAVAFCVQAAVRRLGCNPPPIIEMTSYHGVAGRMVTGRFLPAPGIPVRTRRLNAQEQECKRRMLACFTTQQPTLASFGVGPERFRLAPEYDFTRPPHAGALFYEGFPWGATGAEWRQRVSEAARELALPTGARK